MIVALLLMVGPACAEEAVITGFRPLPLVSGVNRVQRLAPDGRAGFIILASRANGNAWGYNVFIVMLSGGLVGIERPDNTPRFADTIRDTPHTGEDVIGAVRFARARVNGHASVVLLEAIRTIVDDPYAPAITTFDVFAIQSGDFGVTSDYLARVRHVVLPDRYCNAEMALARASGLPLRPAYEGKKTPNAC